MNHAIVELVGGPWDGEKITMSLPLDFNIRRQEALQRVLTAANFKNAMMPTGQIGTLVHTYEMRNPGFGGGVKYDYKGWWGIT